ncbi:MAG: hypothetical protein CMM44_11520 [Rhodospirillaceae bacterium]|nr:hypothetical protein [Rhodospirillaceae bacterium]
MKCFPFGKNIFLQRIAIWFKRNFAKITYYLIWEAEKETLPVRNRVGFDPLALRSRNFSNVFKLDTSIKLLERHIWLLVKMKLVTALINKNPCSNILPELEYLR